MLKYKKTSIDNKKIIFLKLNLKERGRRNKEQMEEIDKK